MRTELAKAQWGGYFPEQSHHIEVFYAALSVRIVLGPESDELVQVVGAEDGPIASQVVKVVHDDSNEQVDDLEMEKEVH